LTNLNGTLGGTNLIADPFYQVDDNACALSFGEAGAVGFSGSPMNKVACLFSAGEGQPYLPIVTNGTTFANWIGSGFVTDTNNWYLSDHLGSGNPQWLPNGDVALLPGMGVMAVLPTISQNVSGWFIGLVRESVTNQILMGTNYLGSALPIAGGISSDLKYTNATAGDTLIKWDPTNQVSVIYTNYGGTNWSPNEPYIGIAEGFILVSTNNHTWVQTFSPCPGN